MTKLTTAEALQILDLASIPAADVLAKAYKVAALRAHPDKGGDTQTMQAVNAAFELLEGMAPSVEAVEAVSAWSKFEEELAAHPLNVEAVPSLKTYGQNLADCFDIRTKSPRLFFACDYRDNGHRRSRSGIYWRENGRDFMLTAPSDGATIRVTDITHAGRSGKVCRELCIQLWRMDGIAANYVADLLRGAGIDPSADDFSWSQVFDAFAELPITTDWRARMAFNAYGRTFNGNNSQGMETADLVGKIFVSEEMAAKVCNPFTLREIYKPMGKLPEKANWTIKQFVQLLVNGQFHHCRQVSYLTDDYAHDAATNSGRRMHEHPLMIAKDWIETRSSCKRIYRNTHRSAESMSLSFGHHSNDHSTLVIDLDCAYPVVDLTEAPRLEAAA